MNKDSNKNSLSRLVELANSNFYPIFNVKLLDIST